MSSLRLDDGLRKNAGYKSAGAFAEALGVKSTTYYEYELGRATLSYELAWRIADVLGCSLDELGGRQFDPAMPTSDESELVALYRSADERGRASVMAAAKHEARDGVEAGLARGA